MNSVISVIPPSVQYGEHFLLHLDGIGHYEGRRDIVIEIKRAKKTGEPRRIGFVKEAASNHPFIKSIGLASYDSTLYYKSDAWMQPFPVHQGKDTRLLGVKLYAKLTKASNYVPLGIVGGIENHGPYYRFDLEGETVPVIVAHWRNRHLYIDDWPGLDKDLLATLALLGESSDRMLSMMHPEGVRKVMSVDAHHKLFGLDLWLHNPTREEPSTPLHLGVIKDWGIIRRK